MNRILTLFTLLFFACAPQLPINTPWQEIAKTEMIKICWDNDKALVEEACQNPEYVRWERTSVTVTSDSAMKVFVVTAVKAWNEDLGFEMFRYKELDVTADVIFARGGPHPNWRGVTTYAKQDGRMRALIFMFDGALDSTSTYLHELGHAIGLEHDEKDTRSIMYPNNLRVFPKVQAKDRRMLIDLYSPRKRH